MKFLSRPPLAAATAEQTTQTSSQNNWLLIGTPHALAPLQHIILGSMGVRFVFFVGVVTLAVPEAQAFVFPVASR